MEEEGELKKSKSLMMIILETKILYLVTKNSMKKALWKGLKQES